MKKAGDDREKGSEEKEEEWTIQKTQRCIVASNHQGYNEEIQWEVKGHWEECRPTAKKEVML